MTDPSFTPNSERELLVVYATSELATRARERLVEIGVDTASIRIDEESDEIASLRAEMHEELTQAWIVPTASFVATKEGVKGMGLVGAVAILVGLALAIPLAFVDFGATLAVRLVVFSVIAVTGGATFGFIAGASMGSKPPGELMAAHRGTVLRVSEDTPAVRAALVELHPIRVDEIREDDTPLETVMTEDDTIDEGIVEQVAATLGGDDHHPKLHPERSDDQPDSPARRSGADGGDNRAGRPDPELREDPRTGSTPADPSAQQSGPPPEGRDPMDGEAPSG